MEKNSSLERRIFPRFKIDFPIEIIGVDFQFRADVKDISCNGVFCHSKRYLPVRTKLKIAMELPAIISRGEIAGEVNWPATVTRIDPPHQEQPFKNYKLGISFSSIKKQDRNLILKFVRLRNSAQAKELKKMYLKLKAMASKLTVVEECHPSAAHFRKVIGTAIKELDMVAQILDAEIDVLKNME